MEALRPGGRPTSRVCAPKRPQEGYEVMCEASSSASRMTSAKGSPSIHPRTDQGQGNSFAATPRKTEPGIWNGRLDARSGSHSCSLVA